jgi:hypothetical protein
MILLWALVVAAPYASLDPLTAPRGIEYYILIQSNHVWTRFAECGACALWNGSVRGGAPAFADPHASLLHPLVIVTTLLFGVIVGSKLTLVGAFFCYGAAQWWLAHVLGLGRAARLWSAGMAVACGFLAAQMDEGLVGMALSTGACALVLSPLIELIRAGRRRGAVMLAITLALAIVAGQGYMQVGLALLAPALLLLPRAAGVAHRLLLRRFALAFGIAALLAAPFLVPFLHFLPQFRKFSDTEITSAQAFLDVLSYLVIGDRDFYTNRPIGQSFYPFLHANFIGWVPLVLAGWGLYAARGRAERRTVLALLLFGLGACWLASGTPLRWVSQFDFWPWLAGQAASLRNCSLIAGWAIPPILALAGLGLDRLLGAPWLASWRSPWQSDRAAGSDQRWLLAFPLTLALFQAYTFGSGWIGVEPVPAEAAPIVAALRTPDVQWVNTPIGINAWEERAVASGLKLAYGFRAWEWVDRPIPQAALLLSVHGSEPDMRLQRSVTDKIRLFAAAPEVHYATLTDTTGHHTACSATGRDGQIDVRCDSPAGGTLALAENNWSGWQARVGGQPAPIRPAPLISLDIPPGQHLISLRYRPWDVPAGGALGLLGALSAAVIWRRGEP